MAFDCLLINLLAELWVTIAELSVSNPVLILSAVNCSFTCLCQGDLIEISFLFSACRCVGKTKSPEIRQSLNAAAQPQLISLLAPFLINNSLALAAFWGPAPEHATSVLSLMKMQSFCLVPCMGYFVRAKCDELNRQCGKK